MKKQDLLFSILSIFWFTGILYSQDNLDLYNVNGEKFENYEYLTYKSKIVEKGKSPGMETSWAGNESDIKLYFKFSLDSTSHTLMIVDFIKKNAIDFTITNLEKKKNTYTMNAFKNINKQEVFIILDLNENFVYCEEEESGNFKIYRIFTE